jgi:hypothetical protein
MQVRAVRAASLRFVLPLESSVRAGQLGSWHSWFPARSHGLRPVLLLSVSMESPRRQASRIQRSRSSFPLDFCSARRYFLPPPIFFRAVIRFLQVQTGRVLELLD